MGFTNVKGVDALLPAGPPLVDPPLSLIGLSRELINVEGLVATQQEAADRARSAQEQLEALDDLGDRPGEADTLEDAGIALEQQRREWEDRLAAAEAMESEASKRLADIQRWEHGFVYLPELPLAATEVWAPDTVLTTEAYLAAQKTNTKAEGNNQQATAWYDPFEAVGLDDRSAFGWPGTDYGDRAQRAQRGLRAHEPWQVEYEFWTGAKIPTNFHLSASPSTPTSSKHRDIDAWTNPTAAPGTVLGTAVGLRTALAALDQAIASSDAGTGMIHCTPYLMQCFMAVFPFIRDPDGKVYTVNHNLLVPGYGYPGTGPDQATRAETDGATTDTSTTFTSASAAFTTSDLGRTITETDAGGHIPAGTRIVAVTNATTVTLSAPAVGSATNVHFTVSGTGGDATMLPKQWAYATEMVFHLKGDVLTYPYDLREMSPALTVDDDVPVRAERSWALITNRLLRAAVLVDTTQTN